MGEGRVNEAQASQRSYGQQLATGRKEIILFSGVDTGKLLFNPISRLMKGIIICFSEPFNK